MVEKNAGGKRREKCGISDGVTRAFSLGRLHDASLCVAFTYPKARSCLSQDLSSRNVLTLNKSTTSLTGIMSQPTYHPVDVEQPWEALVYPRYSPDLSTKSSSFLLSFLLPLLFSLLFFFLLLLLLLFPSKLQISIWRREKNLCLFLGDF